MKMYKLFNGDCLEVMKELPENSIDMILTDLPYGVTDAKWDKALPFNLLWVHYNRVLKPDGACLLFGVQPFTTKIIHSNLKNFRYCWYWLKNNVTGGQFAKVQPMRRVEDIAVFYQKKPVYNPQGLVKLDKPLIKKKEVKTEHYKWRGGEVNQIYTNYPNNVLQFKNEAKKKHSTGKPVQLLEYLIKTYTNEGQTVLDSCMGSGSSGVACGRTGRRFIGIELYEPFYKLACNNIIAAYENKEAVL